MNQTNTATKVFCVASILALSIPLSISGYVNRNDSTNRDRDEEVTATTEVAAPAMITLDPIRITDDRETIVLPEMVVVGTKPKVGAAGAVKSDKSNAKRHCSIRNLIQGSGQVKECE